MTSGYYDYDVYSAAILRLAGQRRDVLEVGVGTGLVCEKLLELSQGDVRITGIDTSASMLGQARRRLRDRVRLEQQDVLRLALNQVFDVVYSVGGVWAFTRTDDGIPMASFLRSDSENEQAFGNLRSCLRPGGILLVAVQRPHVDHSLRLPGGLAHRQEVHDAGDNLLTEDYWITDGPVTVAHQRSTFRILGLTESVRLLARCGFRSDGLDADGLFHCFTRV
ncbi:class I SAM-dependent methyltransferase [Kibdelosporangium phytohabitans]|nr:class I SAM-dependent methyltransferase [Kibdelosporangium phytohabitans]